MQTISVKNARSQLKSILDRVQAGEEVAILRRGKVIARLVPPSPLAMRLPSLKAFRASIKKSGPPLSTTVREARNEERA